MKRVPARESLWWHAKKTRVAAAPAEPEKKTHEKAAAVDDVLVSAELVEEDDLPGGLSPEEAAEALLDACLNGDKGALRRVWKAAALARRRHEGAPGRRRRELARDLRRPRAISLKARASAYPVALVIASRCAASFAF